MLVYRRAQCIGLKSAWGLTRFVTNRGGTFDVEVDGTLIYSKANAGRHANPGEVLGLFRDFVGAETAVYER